MELIYSKKLEFNDALECKNKELNLEYYLVASEAEDSYTYGIQVNMTKDTGESETAAIKNVSPSKDSVIELIKLLYSNSVTPVSVHDVIYDCIA